MVETSFLHDLSQAEGEVVARNVEALIENTFSPYFGRKKIKFLLCTDELGWPKPHIHATIMTTDFILPGLNRFVSNEMFSFLIPE